MTDAVDRQIAEMRETRMELSQDIRGLRQAIFYGVFAMMLSQLGVIASIVAVH